MLQVHLVDGFGTYPTGWHIPVEGDLPNQVAVSTGSVFNILIHRLMNIIYLCTGLVYK